MKCRSQIVNHQATQKHCANVSAKGADDELSCTGLNVLSPSGDHEMSHL
jgi:hypothetical protein